MYETVPNDLVRFGELYVASVMTRERLKQVLTDIFFIRIGYLYQKKKKISLVMIRVDFTLSELFDSTEGFYSRVKNYIF